MKNPKRIVNEDTWKDDHYWQCPYCLTKNELTSWMDTEECENCHKIQLFESDYIDAYEGMISTNYLGPED